jgi:hypothetical protein
MQVHCTQCGVQIPADDLNIDTGIAKCRACNCVFSFLEALREHSAAERTRPPTAERPAVPQPRGVAMDDLGGRLRLVRRWFQWPILMLLFFCVAWDGFLVFWYSIAFTQKAPWIMVVFPVVHVAVGIAMTYGVLCGFFNRTVIEVEGGRFTIQHGPLPWPGNRTIDTADLKQLYCRQRVRNTRNGTSETYELHAQLADGKQLKLISGLDEAEQALFLEQQIEKYLGIKDVPVAGEFR